jgi:predicted 3-demethylubiquinone-9 3-methyltransferase (glyoxalase superfamily)
MHKITPFFWFEDGAEEAADLYVSIFGGLIIERRFWGSGGPAPAGTLMSVTFEIDGRQFEAFNGGPGHPFTDATSLCVSVDTQEELDDAWSRLLDGGGQPVACGWLRDRFGLSWQIVPTILESLLTDPDPDRSSRALKAMLEMTKLDIAQLQAAADG